MPIDYKYAQITGEISLERDAQKRRGYDTAHDDEQIAGELAQAAAYHALGASYQWCGVVPVPNGVLHSIWPWPDRHPKDDLARRKLICAAALIVAEIERLDRHTAGGADRHTRTP